ncbi:nicotinate phosphoribosyltransferase [Kutzneria sp. CA-103260]|uniref:nicotinate phosphoribosyltransferase n=1 Tax=Kutzneria sp. CA-103260 TaxID=2802641 RepID=UPI001BA87EBA|nr:nicotinate phosphoribosyltransferase [Kutzneria sp. CA-103260]QUQ64097.1 nicotinate phosphoribosyltransferase [Kutzneria sp. CA-103260]
MTGLRTDLYEIRMAVSYLRQSMSAPATFSLFVRQLPADRGFLVAAGLADCLAFLGDFRFTARELRYLGDAVELSEADLTALAGLRFTGDVRAIPEGRVVFAGEPLLEVTAPIAQAQLVETALLNLVTYQTALASKAARCRLAADGAALVDFSARRTHGWDAAMAAARSAAIVGFASTSNAAAARRYGLPPAGTMAHSYVEAFPSELAAFSAFVADFPDAAVLLVDTYDTAAGVRAAIDVARRTGTVLGIRLDSGDLWEESLRARRMLDDADLPRVQIMASGGLDEHAIASLVARGAPIDHYGVGTRMGVSADAPALDSAYKLVEYAGEPVMKLSPGKETLPGAKQVFRGAAGGTDVLALRHDPAPDGMEPLLVPVMRDGRPVNPRLPARATVAAARARFEADLEWLPARARQVAGAAPVPVRPSAALSALAERVRESGQRYPVLPRPAAEVDSSATPSGVRSATSDGPQPGLVSGSRARSRQ